MKARYIVLGLLLSAALTVSARMYTKGEKVYVNVLQSGVDDNDWSKYDAKLFLYFFQSTAENNNKWVSLEPIEPGSKVYVGKMPDDIHSWYDRVSVVRKSPSGTAGNWNDRWNQSCDIKIPNNYNPKDNSGCNCNFLNEFYSKSNFDDKCTVDRDWKEYAPTASSIPSASSLVSDGVTMEKISICPNDLGGPFSLRAKLNSSKTQYVYDDVKGHGWYMSYNGNTWSEVLSGSTGVPTGGIDNEIDINKNQLPGSLSGGVIYYYLHSCIPSGRRLIQLKTNSTNCDLDCEITSFETAVSDVNADDNTYTLDGMVAFGKANGNLVISCDGVDTTIAVPQSPQTFSLHGVPAATVSGKKTTATAYFVGDQTNCSKVITIDVPNAKEAIDVVTVDSLTGKTFVLTPKDYDPANKYVWFANGDTIKGASQILTIDPYGKDSTTEYTYKEYYPASGSMDDIIDNGDYENATGYGIYKQKSTISDNDFWGIYNNSSSQMNFYDTCSLAEDKKSNGFAVVRSAYNFYPTYAKITAKSGNNFALFDAATGAAGANKKAWYATTATSSKLKLQKGTTYVLSFWAANVNNYGEMENAARFKFRIEYNSKKWESKELNLADAEFRNNIWHQCSQTFYADEDCDNVTISVVNLNNNTLNVGNDFALDDIQFHPISTVSKVVKSQQKFIVNAHEPKIDAFTTTVVPLKCDEGPSYKLNIHVTFQNPKGNLVIRDLTTGVDSVYAVSAPFDTATPFDKVFTVTTNDPTHNWMAFFDGWTSAQKTSSTIIPGFPSIDTLNVSFSHPTCGEIYDTLFFDLDYTYQQGKLHFNVDGKPDSIRTVTTSKSKQTITKLFYVGVPADGKVHTLNVSFDGANSCKKSYKLPAAPFSPVIDAVKIVSTSPKVTDPKVSDTLTCSTDSYTVDVAVTLHYDPTGLGKNIQLDYNDGKNPQTKTELATGKTTTISGLTMYNIDDTASLHTIYAQLVGYTPACPDSVKYRAPIRARIQPNFKVNVSEVGCDVTKYTLSGTVNFDKADGNLVVAFIDGSKSQTITAPTGKSANFSISGVDSVGKGMQLKAWFTGSATSACEVLSKPFDSPAIPKIDTLNIKLSEPKCGEVNTTLTFDLAYTYQQGTLTYWVDALTAKTATYNIQKASPDTLKALTFANIPADGKSHALHVKFDGPNSCEKKYDLPAAPFSPVIDAVKIVSTSPKVTDLSVSDTLTCSTDSYTVDVEVTLHYDPTGLGKNIQLDYNDGKNPQTKTESATGKTVTFTGLTMQNIDDTASLHTIYAELVGYTPACPDSVKYRAPIHARIQSNFAVTVGETTCCKTNYTLSGTVNFDKADGNLVVAFIDGSKSQTITAPTGKSADFTISGVDSVGKGMQLKAWFTGSATSACEVLSKSFDSPVVPKIDTLNVKYNPLACTDLTATLLFDLEYIYQQGALSYWVDDMTPISGPTYKVKQETPDTLKALSFAGIPADGKAHTLEVKFAHANACDKTYTLPAAPFSPVINSISVTGTPSKVFCNVNEYLATVTINVPYDALGQKIILSYDDKGGAKDTTITVNSGNADVAGKVITVKLTLHNMDSLTQTVKAAFATSPTTCTPKTASYTPPTRMTCEKYYATICEGENYDGSLDTPKNDFKINTPKVGLDTFTIAGLTDTLFLTVIAIPKISTGTMAVTCDDASSIHIPFTVTNGDPDTIDIKIIGCDTCKYVGTISGSDIVFARAPELVAGDYSAWVVTGHKGSVCKDSVQVNFSIALGGAMYSKWTDVIFISNAGNQFIAYEWYENGVALDGETMQRLYKPEGLLGTYYCRLTKTDGKIITTCEQSFDKIQPSRSAGDPSAAQVVRKYRVSPHVYIIQTVREDGFVDTKKVLTPYE